MALITKPNTLTNGTVAQATDVDSDFNTIYNDYNGNITNANISASAAIDDSKLAQVATSSKVNGTSLTNLAGITSAAGIIPAANLEVIPSFDFFSGSSASGWAASPTGTIYVKKIGKTVFVNYNITGTSNSSATAFMVPYTVVNVSNAIGYTKDNNVATTSGGLISINASTDISCYKDASAAVWTTAGVKTIAGQFWYQTT